MQAWTEDGVGRNILASGPTVDHLPAVDPKIRCSLAFFCPHCGEVWARIQRSDYWLVRSVSCEVHGNEYNVGGDMFDVRWDEEHVLVKENPALLAHQFRVLMAWAEKYPERVK